MRRVRVAAVACCLLISGIAAFAGAAEAMGVSSEDDIQALVDEVRYGKGR